MADRGILFSAPMVLALLDDRKWQTRRIAKPRSRTSILALNEDGSPMWTDSYIQDPGNRDWLLNDAAARPGDTAYAKETIKHLGDGLSVYAADLAPTVADAWPWKVNTLASQYMPRGLARIEREVLDVRIERLHDLSEADAVAEGVQWAPGARHEGHDPRWILGRCRDCAHWNTNLGANGGKRSSCGYKYDRDPTVVEPDYGDAGQGCSHGFSLSDGADETARFQFRHFWDHLHGPTWRDNPLVFVYTFERVSA